MCIMEASSFYGPPPKSDEVATSKRRLRLERAALMVGTTNNFWRGKRLLPTFPDDVHVFSTQKAAIEHAKEPRNEQRGLMVFALEVNADGKRTFFSCHPLNMWQMLRTRKTSKKNFYEVIPEGMQCKLYFDIEYSKAENSDRDGEAALKEFVTLVMRKVEIDLSMQLKDCDVLDLDSSTNEKFSHHVIFNVIFSDNHAVGRFVRELCGELSDHGQFAFKRTDGSTQLFVDCGVYSKNRNFRLFLCSKFGKSSVLRLSTSSSTSFQKWSERDVFLLSLITYFGQSSQQRTVQYGEPRKQVKKMPIKKPMAEERGCHTSSPFPEIDDYVSSLVVPGSVRKIVWKHELAMLEYEIVNFRYCLNVDRWHKSNNIKFVVLLNRGVLFQVCHDPDCADFRSEERPLPLDCQPWESLFADSVEDAQDGFDSDDDDDLLRASEKW